MSSILTINQLYRMLNVWSRRVRRNAAAVERGSSTEHTLLAYLSLDLLLDEDGFVLLIAAGRAEHALSPQLAEALRRWSLSNTPAIIGRARKLYLRYGAAIQAAARRGEDIETMRRRFPQFDGLDEAYCLICEEDFSVVCSHVRRHPADFAGLIAEAGEVGSPLPPDVGNEAPASSP